MIQSIEEEVRERRRCNLLAPRTNAVPDEENHDPFWSSLVRLRATGKIWKAGPLLELLTEPWTGSWREPPAV